MIDEKFKQKVKQALKEIKADEEHERLHEHIRQEVIRRLERGRTGGAFCGECMQVIVCVAPKQMTL